jgi:cyclopropane-fatty-acyl-phospholipid synthase
MRSLSQKAQALIITIFAKARRGSLTLTLPDSTTHHFGSLDQHPTATVTIHDSSFFKDLILEDDIGLGESYENGKWDTDNLTGFIEWLLINKSYFHSNSPDWIHRLLQKTLLGWERIRHFQRRNSIDQSRKNIQFHYDLGNSFYQNFLDPSMTYSSAFFTDENQSLEDAQTEKYNRICQKLNLTPGLHILEIGTGWGGFACHAAKYYGCMVTTTTISDRQFEYAHKRIHDQGLADKIELLKKDYRNLKGTYDRIVSIEMLEAVGHRYLKDYFANCHRLLKPEGLAVYQVIISTNSMYEGYRKRVDWIRKHIFPGGHLPSVNALTSAIENAEVPWELYHSETFALHYARTLREWREAYNRQADDLRQLGVTKEFNRKWNFYLSYCEAGFLQRHVNVAQLVFGRPDIETYSFETTNQGTKTESNINSKHNKIA